MNNRGELEFLAVIVDQLVGVLFLLICLKYMIILFKVGLIEPIKSIFRVINDICLFIKVKCGYYQAYYIKKHKINEPNNIVDIDKNKKK